MQHEGSKNILDKLLVSLNKPGVEEVKQLYGKVTKELHAKMLKRPLDDQRFFEETITGKRQVLGLNTEHPKMSADSCASSSHGSPGKQTGAQQHGDKSGMLCRMRSKTPDPMRRSRQQVGELCGSHCEASKNVISVPTVAHRASLRRRWRTGLLTR